MTKMIGMLIPEIYTYYGPNATFEIIAEISATAEDVIKISKDYGISIGGDDLASFSMYIYAANDTTPKILAAQFVNDFQVYLNFSLSNFIVYPLISSYSVNNTQVVVNNCNLYKRNYDSMFNDIMDLAQS